VIFRVFATVQSKACASGESTYSSLCCQDFSETPPVGSVGFTTSGAINAGSKGNNMTNDVKDIATPQQLQPGDRIYARGEIRSDGSIPGV
jgi:hypothetical protein